MPNGLDYVATNLVMRSALLNESGATLSLTNRDVPTDGFYVGGVITTLVVRKDEIKFPTVRTFLDRLASLSVPFVGFWVDSATDMIHFDGVDWFWSERDALHLARVREEIAIWDVARAKEVRL